MDQRAAVSAATGPPTLSRADHHRAATTASTDSVAVQREGSPYDLRRRRLTAVGTVNEINITDEVATALRELMLLDPDCERLVFSMHAHHGGAVLHASEGDLEELIGGVAAEANHETNRRRQRRLDSAFDALNAAAQTLTGR